LKGDGVEMGQNTGNVDWIFDICGLWWPVYMLVATVL